MRKQLEDSLIKLETTAQSCFETLNQEREKRFAITEQIQRTQQELEILLNGEEKMIRDLINIELEKPLSIGQKFQQKLNKQIEVASFKHNERTYIVDEIQEQITDLRGEYFLLEKQLQSSQAQVQAYGNQLNSKQSEYLDLQFLQTQKNRELKEIQEEVHEMKELLQKVKEVQFTLNKVIGKNNNNDMSKTNSTEEAFKISKPQTIQFEQNQSNNENFWYTLPPTPPLKLPRIK